MKIYLSYPITGRNPQELHREIKEVHRSVRAWFLEFASWMKDEVEIIDPMRGKWEHFQTKDKFDGTHPEYSPNAIVQRDLSDIERCDAMIMIDGGLPSWGTVLEMGYALWVAEKPVVIVSTIIRHYSWAYHLATNVCSSIDEALKYIYWYFK